ncbi:MAG TPA: WXG100 family type VII secretion target [Streptosporangiaceae bacterium]|nr:WXG100 family type VII secretion target [Streptosporangiaceae bacterium]
MRLIPFGGSQVAVGNTYTVKTETVVPCDVSAYSAAQIEKMLHGLRPSAVEQAGAAHSEASATLHTIAGNLVKHMSVLAESWQGQAAQAAAGRFRQLYETAVALSQASHQTGSVLSWLGGTILPFYTRYSVPQVNSVVSFVDHAVGYHPRDKAAQQILQRLNNRLVQANGGLPPSVHSYLAGTQGDSPIMGHTGTSVGGPAGGGSAGPAGGGATAGAVAGSGAGLPAFSRGPGSLGSAGSPGQLGGAVSRPAVAHLAGYSPPGGAGGGPAGAGPGLGAGGGAPGGGGGPGMLPVAAGGVPGAGGASGLPGDYAAGGPGGEAAPPGAEVPGGEVLGPEAVLGPDGMISGVPGGPVAGDPAVAGGESAGLLPGVPGAGAAGDPVPAGPGDPGTAAGWPGGGAGAGMGDAAAGGADVAGPVDGLGMMPVTGSGAGQRERERYRQSWLPEDPDLWEGGDGTAPPVIGG